MPSFTTDSPDQTKELSAKLAKQLINQTIQTALIIALFGELGSGKTTFVQGFAQGLGISEKVLSPSFVLMRIHQIPKSVKRLIHLDLYRLDDFTSLDELGLSELFADPDNIVLIEWPEKVSALLPKDIIQLKIKRISEKQRRLDLSPGRLLALP